MDLPPQSLVAALEARMPQARGASWHPLAGGRTNAVWALCGPQGQRGAHGVVKLYHQGAPNPLFPNDAAAEAHILRHMMRCERGHRLVPGVICTLQAACGPALVSEWVAGKPWAKDTAMVAHLWRALQAVPAPGGLRRTADGSAALVAQTKRILAQCQYPHALARWQPKGTVSPCGAQHLVHGDLVGGNVICQARAARLVDWQCPAVGDPCEDLATFLSPAMQWLYRGAVLSQSEEADFLHACQSPLCVARYRQLAPFYHWRMVAYCQWRQERAAPAYAEAQKWEMQALARRAS